MNKKMAAAWLICFALLLLMPGAVWVAAKERFQTDATENTVSTEIPKLTKDNYRDYPGLVESAFNAAVPFRSQLISFSSLTDLKLFCEKSINDKVVIGSDNWLFYSMESDIDDYKGTNLFTEGQLAQIASQLTTSEQWLSNRGSEFVLMIAPNKETIYGEEHLPSYYKKAEETRTDQLIAYLKKNTDIRIVYPKEEMLKYKKEYSLYWHYDTHWNAAGGYIGAKALLKELGDELPEVEDITFTPDTFSGYDLARMMNLQSYYEKNMPAEENYIVTGYNGNNLQAVSIDDATALVYHSDAFEPFERERTSTVSKIQGTGLGMAITKNIVDMMGGTIEVQTEQGKGTEFIIRVPLRAQAEHRPVEKITELEGLKALVVDDDFNTCDSVTKMLVKVGMRSEWTLSGKEAVLRARQSIEMSDAYHAYIIDWRLPDMNGIEVTRQIRSLNDDTPIIILTAYDWSDIEVEAKAAGVTAFCSKPMFLSDLRETLMSALGQKRTDAAQELLPEKEESFKGRTILLVEDNELNREIALEILREYGFQVDTAENGAVAVEKVRTSAPGRYDLVLMDVQMPVMDGYTATRQIRALEDPALAGIPILAMTANAFDEDRRNALASGMNGFLSKPIIVGDLVQELRKILSDARSPFPPS